MITKPKKAEVVKARYTQGVGGRKTAISRVRLYSTKGDVTVNGKPYREYFKMPKHQVVVVSPFKLLNTMDAMSASVHVSGGGIAAQADAVRHGIARALVSLNEEFRARLRAADFLTRDSRMVERKKYGLKKARKAPQWAKR